MALLLRSIVCALAAATAGAGTASPTTAEVVARAALEQSVREKHPHLAITLRHADASSRNASGTGWRVRSVDSALRRRMGVMLESWSQPPARVRVEFIVTAQATGWRLVHATEPSATLTPADLMPSVEDAVLNPDLAIGQDVARWRVVRHLPEGHLLRQTDVTDARSVLRGDIVDVRLDAGAVSVRAVGTALAAARPGETVKVALPGRREAVSGIVGEDRQVIVKP